MLLLKILKENYIVLHLTSNIFNLLCILKLYYFSVYYIIFSLNSFCPNIIAQEEAEEEEYEEYSYLQKTICKKLC